MDGGGCLNLELLITIVRTSTSLPRASCRCHKKEFLKTSELNEPVVIMVAGRDNSLHLKVSTLFSLRASARVSKS
jgi:hypothetical protein